MNQDIDVSSINYISKNFFGLQGYVSASFGLIPVGISVQQLNGMQWQSSIFKMGIYGADGYAGVPLSGWIELFSWSLVLLGLVGGLYFKKYYYPKRFGTVVKAGRNKVYTKADGKTAFAILGLISVFGCLVVIDETTSVPLNLAFLMISVCFLFRARTAPIMRRTLFVFSGIMLFCALLLPQLDFVYDSGKYSLSPLFAFSMSCLWVFEGLIAHKMLVGLIRKTREQLVV
ncbi:hypothetical protein [Agaribacter marinus]|uniref:Uncharacterized protein n=1 Tax=Agaribacter marinus TaxID=1431249 RepID=A0AA37T334_9ALTE|nr:hypothetical protein [Agaribacter marinus]GLR72686.1 hypothetical protein GCM10007852_35940 [Agaribacter marinus]